ncbi:hypothetical protein FRC00_002058, partial [Tulasnella sp. 408]
MKFSSIEAANSAEQHRDKNRKIRDPDGTHWRLRLLKIIRMSSRTPTDTVLYLRLESTTSF